MKKLLLLLLPALFAPAALFASPELLQYGGTYTPPFAEERVELQTESGTLYGTLAMPEAISPVPLVIIAAGSGPTDRNGNQRSRENNNGLMFLGHRLAEQQIATLRYDKRGIGESRAVVTREEDAVIEDFANDLRLWTQQYADDPRFSTILIAGHSEGALLGMLAARENPAVGGLILLAGPGRPLDAILKEQLARQLEGEILADAFSIIDSLKAGQQVESISGLFAPLFRLSVQPFLISAFRLDPRQIISGLNIPILIVQGTTDIQIGLADAEALAAACPDAEKLVIENMTHGLREYSSRSLPLQQLHSSKADLPLHPQLVLALGRFIRQVR